MELAHSLHTVIINCNSLRILTYTIITLKEYTKSTLTDLAGTLILSKV